MHLSHIPVNPILRLTLCVPRKLQTSYGMWIGAEIRRRRKALGMTIEAFAAELRSDVGNVSRIERDLQQAPTDMLKKIAKTLNVRVYELFAAAEQVLVAEVSQATVEAVALYNTLQSLSGTPDGARHVMHALGTIDVPWPVHLPDKSAKPSLDVILPSAPDPRMPHKMNLHERPRTYKVRRT